MVISSFMNKHVNLIIYKPGYGGHFIQYLFSLYSSTYFWKSSKITTLDRKDHYSFQNIYSRFGTWRNHHRSFYLAENVKTHFPKVCDNFLFQDSSCSILNLGIHPAEYYSLDLVNQILQDHCTIKYFQVILSEKLTHVIDQFKNFNHHFPYLRPGEHEQDIELMTRYNPEIINFDNFVLGEDSFLSEYNRLCPLFNVPANTATALELYRDWYAERQFDKFLTT